MEQELRERIAERLWNWYRGYSDIRQGEWQREYEAFKLTYYRRADQILALVKEALPELAREAGYKSPEEIDVRYRESVGETWHWQGDGTDHLESITCPIVVEIGKVDSLAKEAGYVKLAEDQALKA